MTRRAISNQDTLSLSLGLLNYPIGRLRKLLANRGDALVDSTKERSAALPVLSRRLVTRLCQRGGPRRVDGENAVESRDLEHLPDMRIGGDELDAPGAI
jgi:hypothetical protein